MLNILEKTLIGYAWRNYIKPPRNTSARDEKAMLICEFIYRFGFTTPTILQELLNIQKRGVANHLIRLGFLKERVVNLPECKKLFGLTKYGFEYIKSEGRLSSYKYVNIDDMSLNSVPHDLRVQKSLLSILAGGQVTHFVAANQLKSLARKFNLSKAPDLIIRFMSGLILVFEAEISGKRGLQFHLFWQAIIEILGIGENIGVLITTDTQSLFDRYEPKSKKGACIEFRELNHHGTLVRIEDEYVTRRQSDSISVILSTDGKFDFFRSAPYIFYDGAVRDLTFKIRGAVLSDIEFPVECIYLQEVDDNDVPIGIGGEPVLFSCQQSPPLLNKCWTAAL